MKKLSEESAASIETAIYEALVPYREGEEGQVEEEEEQTGKDQ